MIHGVVLSSTQHVGEGQRARRHARVTVADHGFCQIHAALRENCPQIKSTPLFMIRTTHKSSPLHSLSSELPTNQVHSILCHQNCPQIKSNPLFIIRTTHRSSLRIPCSLSELPTDQVHPALFQHCPQIKSTYTPLFVRIVHKSSPPCSLSQLSTNHVHPALCHNCPQIKSTRLFVRTAHKSSQLHCLS